MPPDAASIARYAKQRRQHGGREGCPKADADAALKARPGRVIFIAIPKTSLNLRLRKCAAAGDLVRLFSDEQQDRHHLFRRNASSVLARNRPASNFAAQNEF
jgi:hypothetical protein